MDHKINQIDDQLAKKKVATGAQGHQKKIRGTRLHVFGILGLQTRRRPLENKAAAPLGIFIQSMHFLVQVFCFFVRVCLFPMV
jgi:hypothetical protein